MGNSHPPFVLRKEKSHTHYEGHMEMGPVTTVHHVNASKVSHSVSSTFILLVLCSSLSCQPVRDGRFVGRSGKALEWQNQASRRSGKINSSSSLIRKILNELQCDDPRCVCTTWGGGGWYNYVPQSLLHETLLEYCGGNWNSKIRMISAGAWCVIWSWDIRRLQRP